VARPANEAVRKEFAYWLALPKRLKVSLGLPKTEKEFAEAKGVHPRTIRRWKEEPKFQEMVEAQKAIVLSEAEDSTIKRGGAPVRVSDDPVLEPGLTSDEQRYLQVKDTLVRMAMDGNQGAMDLYLKHYGKSFVDAERQEYKDYVDFSDDRLANEVLDWVGVERVSRWLADRAAVEA
jgi:hypothetical protein